VASNAAAKADTFPKLLIQNAQLYGSRPAMRHKDLGIWQTWTWAEVLEVVRAYAVGLHHLGLERGETIAIVGANRPKLYWSVMAAQMLGAVPVPVYAEMSAINPVLLFPAVLDQKAEALGAAYAASLSMGVGQFCTNPGLVLALDCPALDRFVAAAAEAVSATSPATMLTPGIHAAYEEGVERLLGNAGATLVARGAAASGCYQGQAALFLASADDFLADEAMSQEVFGASSVLVRCADEAAMTRVIAALEGQLTATVHFAGADEAMVGRLLPQLEGKVGRLIANGWPTGVEVSHAMVHGGPFPATSDGRSTSVGTLAIDRFLRPVCYQDFPASLLPAPLKPGAQDGVPHRFDGRLVTG